MGPEGRKTVRHDNEVGHAHLLTFSCYKRTPILTNDAWRGPLSRCIDRAGAKHGYHLIAFVFMPEHVHLLVHPQEDDYRIDRYLHAVKRPFSFRVGRELRGSGSRLLDRLVVRERPGVSSFRFWQEGPGHDRNLATAEAVEAALHYIHNNPVKRGLVRLPGAWRWSSWRYYNLPESAPDPALPTVHGFPS